MNIRSVSTIVLLFLLQACGGGGESTASDPGRNLTRVWDMGFYYTPPRPEYDDVIKTIDLSQVHHFMSSSSATKNRQTFSTDGRYKRSDGEWGFSMVGPKEIISIPFI